MDGYINSPRHEIIKILHPDKNPTSWHFNRRGVTGIAKWFNIYREVDRAWASDVDGIITVFPQRAAIAGLRKRFTGADLPIIAWCLNIGRLYPGLRRTLARYALGTIDAFVVHSRRECDIYSQWYGLPRDRFEFVPLQRGYAAPSVGEETDDPFILSMGSAQRDYRTLFEAVGPLGIRTIVVASPRCMEGLTIPQCVEFRTDLSREECAVLTQQARLTVVPILNDDTASGQITVVQAMWLGRPVVATKCIGTEDYITSGSDGFLVERVNPIPLRERIKDLWDNLELRCLFGQRARDRAMKYYSDEGAGAALSKILDRFS